MDNLLDMPARHMLDEFGKGIGMPGSGPVAIVSTMSGLHLLVSICKLTLNKEKYHWVHQEMRDIEKSILEEYLPRLDKIMHEDADTVKNMVRMRILRDKETDPQKKQEYRTQALQHLEKATDTMIELCSICLDIIPMALHTYQVGLKSAQGDSVVALSNLLSGASSGLYMVLCNMQTGKNCQWANSKRAIVETFFGRLHEYQYIFSGRLASLYNKV